MPSFQKIKSSRVNNASANVYVGNAGTMFFNSATGALRLSDGVTPGGQPVTVAIAGNVTFGNISVVDTTISTIMPNADLTLESNGTGDVNILGNLKAYVTGANVQSAIPVFSVSGDGQVQMLVPGADSLAGALEIVGNDSGLYLPPNQTGVILHVTGNSGLVGRNYFDANQNYALLVGRRYNGTQASPTKVLNGEMFFRIAGQASTDTGFETFGPAQIDWVATEDQSPGNQGGELRFRATPNGANAQTGGSVVATVNATTGLTATKFNGPLTGNVTGNISGTTGSFTRFSGKYIRNVRDAGTITDGGTLTVDMSTDAIVYCTWGNGMNLVYTNFTPGSIVKVIATKSAGTGNDNINLDGVTAAQTSAGTTTVSGTAGSTTFLELTSTTGDIAGLFIKS